jgi:ubiquinone biosynthesis protein
MGTGDAQTRCQINGLGVHHLGSLRLMLRLLRIVFEVLRFALSNLLRRIRVLPAHPDAPERLRLALARLGTTFIKFGQALSIRRDMLPDDYIVALQSLQDHIAPFPAGEAIREIEHGLGRPIAELFQHFESEPLAAASVAQVHTARLADGRNVIVKVRRPHIKAQIERDMRALAWVARIAAALIPSLRRYQPLGLIDEIWSNLRKEVDFRQEARNIRRFATAFVQWDSLHIPGVIDDLVSDAVVVQERSGGRRIDDPAIAADGPRLAQNFVDAYLHQIFVLGVFHGDPHPGNLFITEEQRICLHDFGLVGFLDTATRRKLAAFTNAFLRQDADWLLDAAIDLGVLGGEMDRGQFRRQLSEIIADYAALPLKDWSLADAFLRVMRLGHGRNILVPYDLLILTRTMFLAENVVRTLDPEFQLLENLQAKVPAVLQAAMKEGDWRAQLDRITHEALVAAQDAPSMLGFVLRQLRSDEFGIKLHIHELQGVKRQVARSINQLALALVIVGLYVSGALLMQHSIGPRAFGDMPVLAIIVFAIAIWLTLRLARSLSRSE